MPQIKTFDLSSRYQLLSPSEELIWMLQQAAFSTWQWWRTRASIRKWMCPAKDLTPVIAKGFLRVSAARGLSSGDYKLSQETERACTTHSKLQHCWFGDRKVIWLVKKLHQHPKRLQGNPVQPQVIYGKNRPLKRKPKEWECVHVTAERHATSCNRVCTIICPAMQCSESLTSSSLAHKLHINAVLHTNT